MVDSSSQTVNRAVARLRSLGIEPPAQPSEATRFTQFPSEIDKLSNEDLGQQLASWAALSSYALFQVSVLDIEEKDAKQAHNLLLSQKSLESCEKQATARKAEAMGHPDVQRAQHGHFEKEAMHRMMKAVLEGFQQNYAAISREISRRQAEVERQFRVTNT